MTPRRASSGPFAIFGLLLLVAGATRLVALELPGHDGDVRVMAGWAERMADVGPWGFYDGSTSIYPALLYPLWALGAVLDDAALQLAIKGMSIPFDLAIGLLLYVVVWRRDAPWPAMAASSLYLLNPAAILAGPVWGQVDSAGTLLVFGALASVAARRSGLAGALGVTAMLVKPQFGLVLLPVLAVAIMRWRSAPGGRVVLARTLAGMALASIVVAAPLALHPGRYLAILEEAAVRQPSTSLNAFNAWGLIIGFKVPDEPYVGAGIWLLMGSVAGVLIALRRRPDLATLLAIGAGLTLAFYFAPTRIHERYLYPVIALLAPFAVTGRGQLAAYLAISVGFAASLAYALHDTTPFTLPEPVASWLTSTAGIWTIGLVLIGSAVAWTWMLFVRHPRLPGHDHDPGP